jgi:hypothetical protein
MHIDVHIPGADLLESIRSHVVSRVRSGVGALSSRVHRVSVRLSEFCGAGRGAVLTACRIEAMVEPMPNAIVADVVAPNPYRAVNEAVETFIHMLRTEVSSYEGASGSTRSPGPSVPAGLPLDGQADSLEARQ